MTEAPDSGHVAYRVDDRIATIRFHRPAKKNAFTTAMYRQFVAAIGEAEQDDRVRATVLTGAGSAFTSGHDLRDFVHKPPTGLDAPVFHLLRSLAFAEKPIIAAVSGPAIGLGTTMLLHCDFVYATDRAMFRMPFVNLGVTPEAGSSLLLPMLAGMQRATELLLLGESFDVATAMSIGLVNRTVPAELLLETAFGTARKLADKAPGAVTASKRLLREHTRRYIDAVLADEGHTFIQRLGAPDTHEAMQAVLQKRKPNFSGF